MPKKRTKRNEIREERKRKRQEQEEPQLRQDKPGKKRRIETSDIDAPPDAANEDHVDAAFDERVADLNGRPEAEYYGILDEQESEAFHHIDKTLRDSESLSTAADLQGHVEMAFNYADGKELKLACSQGFSRFLERLILLSTTAQKKSLLKKFAGHYMTLLQHRFASHICETLFTQCAPVLSDELARGFEGIEASRENGEEEGEESMETLFLATLDETEGYLDFLLTDRFGSHTLRVLLLILSGRPLLDDSTKSVVHSKSKDDVAKDIVVHREWMKSPRRVPESFIMATKKIIQDSTENMDTTILKVLAKHPIGNPTLQLLLDLDITLSKGPKNSKDKDEQEEDGPSLLALMLPGAPKSLSDPESVATDFVKTLLFDQLGSRLLEVLVAKCPGRIFKPLFNSIFKPRLDTFVKNETAAYSVMKAIGRLNKSDLEESVKVIEPIVPTLLQKHRYNVLTTLLERCDARGCIREVEALTAKISTTFGWGYNKIIPSLFLLGEENNEENKEKRVTDPLATLRPRTAILPHAANLANAMLSIDGKSRKAIQTSLSKLSPDALLHFAIESAPTASVVVKALQLPSFAPAAPEKKKKDGPGKKTLSSGQQKMQHSTSSGLHCHKLIVTSLIPHAMALALSKNGHNVLCAVAKVPPSNGLPVHLKQNIISTLAAHEAELRASKEGRRVWYAWNGVLYIRNQALWNQGMKNLVSSEIEQQDQHQTDFRKSQGQGNGEIQNGRQGRLDEGSKAEELVKEKKLRPIDIAMMRSKPKVEEVESAAAGKKKKEKKSKDKSSPGNDKVEELNAIYGKKSAKGRDSKKGKKGKLKDQMEKRVLKKREDSQLAQEVEVDG